MSNVVENKKREFHISECLTLTFNAGLSTRNLNFPIYIDKSDVGLTDYKFGKRKRKMRDDIERILWKYTENQYFTNFNEQKYFNAIVLLSKTITDKYCDILHGQKFRIGVAQKLLNLFLKYLWTLNILGREPFHCPFDAIIKKKLIAFDSDNATLKDWTELDSLEDYKKYVIAVKEAADNKGLSVAKWELITYKRR